MVLLCAAFDWAFVKLCVLMADFVGIELRRSLEGALALDAFVLLLARVALHFGHQVGEFYFFEVHYIGVQK